MDSSGGMERGSRVCCPLIHTNRRHLTPVALLRAMAEKLIPGIPHSTRIAILQQSDDGTGYGEASDANADKTALEYVMSGDGSRNEVMRRVDCTI